jgi:hypothetical protein
MARKVFDVAVDESAEEPIEFEVRFHFADGRPPESEAFTAMGRESANVTLIMGSLARFTDDGRQVTDLAGLTKFFHAALTDESWARFDALLRDKTRVVRNEHLGQIMNWLVEELSGRPTQPSSRS